MIWKSIENDRRGPTDLLILLRLVVRDMRNVQAVPEMDGRPVAKCD